jgi:hypothetical protein
MTMAGRSRPTFCSHPATEERMKSKAIGGASVRELKAETLDKLVKAELAKKRAADASKMSKLRALRLARDVEEAETSAPAEQPARISIARKSMRARDVDRWR